MKVFMDTEFTGLHQNTTLISIGLVAEDGKHFYAELTDYSRSQLDDWLRTHVIDNLIYEGIPGPILVGPSTDMCADKRRVAQCLDIWLSQFDWVTIVADVLAYDWILFCELFGGAEYIPSNVSYIPLDLATMFEMKGIDRDIGRCSFADKTPTIVHNALEDAEIVKLCYEKLTKEY